MRWKKKDPKPKPPKPRVGDKKIKMFFALFPVRINKDYRWLEYVTVEYEFIAYEVYIEERGFDTWYKWDRLRFIDKENTDGAAI